MVKDFEVDEGSPLDPPSPYARTKRMVEMVLQDMAAATALRAIILRYFNPILRALSTVISHRARVRLGTQAQGRAGLRVTASGAPIYRRRS
jgi:UDP-glucose 4-epimerase